MDLLEKRGVTVFWDNLRSYYKEHKAEIVLIGLGIICLGTCIALGVRYRKNKVIDSQLIAQVAKNIKDTPYNVVRDSDFSEAISITRSGYNHPFNVSSHIRTLPNGWSASLEKQAVARSMGIALKPGQTIVSAYVKGNLVA